MPIIAYDPEVPVFDRHARSFPKYLEGEPATYGPFSEACATQFDWDAYFAAYSCPAVARRLGTSGAHALGARMVLLVLDVDGPDHRRTLEWDAAIQGRIRAMFERYGRGYAFSTRGGCRVVMGLRDELAIDSQQAALRWRHSYEDWIAGLRADFGIDCDPRCADWTRCFRLPRVQRDGIDVQPDWEIGEPGRMLEWRGDYVAADDPRVLRVETAIDVPEPAPVSDEDLAAAAEAMVAAWPPRSRHYAGMALSGALARSGWSEGAIADFVCYVMARTVGSPEESKWTAQARDVLDKLHRGEQVTGWASLAEILATGASGQVEESRRVLARESVLATRRHLGQPPPGELFERVLELVRPPTGREMLEAARLAGDPIAAGLPSDGRFEALLDEAATALRPAFSAASKREDRERGAQDARPMFMSIRQLLARDIAPPEFLVDGLVPADGVGALSGEPKSGKSWDLLNLCVCAAAGRPAFGRHAVQRPIGVAYFSVEDTAQSVRKRVAAIARGAGLPLDGDWTDRLSVQPRGRELDVCSLFDMSVFVASIWWDDEQQRKVTRLVGLDPLSDLHGKKEDSRDEMSVVMSHFRATQRVLTEHAGASVSIVFVHHSGKDSADTKGRKRGGQKMRGSSAIHGAVDFGIYVMSPDGDKQSTFVGTIESEVKAARGGGVYQRTIKIEDDASNNALRVTWETGDAGLPDAPSDLAEERAHQVVAVLARQGVPMTIDEVKRKIGGKSDLLLAAVKIAEEAGWIRPKFRGGKRCGFEVTEEGQAVARDGSPQATPDPEPLPVPRDPALTVALGALLPG
jgi:hypothetical protein